ncbi:hypothetical protein ACKAV7_014462 [Fusarium commune]
MSLASAFIVRLGQMFRDPPRALVRLSIFGGLSLLLILLTWKGSTSLSYSWTPPISKSELKNISQKAKEYAENPVQAPYKSTFWEIVYAGEDDLPKKDRDRIAKLTGATDVEFLDVFTVFNDTTLKLKDGGWAIKAFALLGSHFEEVILLDADAVFIQQPERLFAQTAYIEKGSLLFHDRLLWQHAFKERHEWWKDQIKEPSAEMNKSLVWTEDYAEECDSGAVVLNKARASTLTGLLHVAWQNTYEVREEVTYRQGHGDKESWWLGLELGGSSYEFESHYGSMIGWGEGKGGNVTTVCSFVIAHTDEKDKLLWYNGSLLKNKRMDPDGYEVPEYWMMDGKWHNGRTKDDMSCMTDTEVLELTAEEKRVLRESIEIAKQVDMALKGTV